MLVKANLEERIYAVRRFNRFITRQIGVLQEGLVHSPYNLAEARSIYELAHRDNLTASDLSTELDIDAGYLSRILARLEQQGLIDKSRSELDGRQRLLHLTSVGRNTAHVLDSRSRKQVAEMLGTLSQAGQERLLLAMQEIESVLNPEPKIPESFVLRSHEPGDMGWITHRHGVLYAKEYGWDERFEALVAQVTADFINNFQPSKERCWIADLEGEIVGSIFVVQKSEAVAKLRLLFVEPEARGLGLGTRLVEECIRFTKKCGYQKLMLWTNSVLIPARHIYAKSGFKLVDEQPHHSFGQDLVGETWELIL